MSKSKLCEEIISYSISQTWDKAKLEWRLKTIYKTKGYMNCLCGHYPIRQLCIIVNRYNGKNLIVGNCCVKNFIGLQSGRIFDSLKRVKLDVTRSITLDAIQIAYEQRWISLREFEFYRNIYTKKTTISPKQLAWKIDINNKILFKCGF